MMLLLASAIAAQPAGASRALALCRPQLEQKAGGEIASIAIESANIGRRSSVIRGPMTVFVGMGPPQPGSASAHHLIRATYHYACWMRWGRVTRTLLTQP